jgi:uncharacterized coiled-coil protein SlyX
MLKTVATSGERGIKGKYYLLQERADMISRLAELTNDLSICDEALKQNYMDIDIDIEELKRENAFLKTRILVLESEVTDQDDKITDQDSKLNEQNDKIKFMLNELADQDDKITDQDSKINEQNDKITDQDSKINEQNDKIYFMLNELAVRKTKSEFDKYLIALQDINSLFQLERAETVSNKLKRQIYSLRTKRVGISHFILKEIDQPEIVNFKISMVLSRLNGSMSTECKDLFEYKFGADFIEEIVLFISKINSNNATTAFNATSSAFENDLEKINATEWWEE